MRVSFFLVWLMLLGSAASAEVLTSKEARSVLFSTKNEAIQLSPALSKADQALIKNLVPLMEKQMRTPVWYYSSIAYSPDEGLVSEALQGAFNFHNVDAADRAALSACNKARKSGTSPCKLAARVLPKGYQSRALTLSQDATSGFTRLYKLDRGARAMAISPTTGAWGIGASDADAIRACKGDRALKDCKVVVRD